MPIGLPHLVKSGDQPWDKNANENMEEIRLKTPRKCKECGERYSTLGRYYSHRRTGVYIEDVCENGCTIRRERVKYQ